MSAPVVGYAGMTHLGINSAVAAASKGFEVVCFDPDPQRVAALARHELPVVEPALPELLAQHASRLTFTADPGALGRCDIMYVSPDVATDDAGHSDLAPIDGLVRAMDAALR